MASFPLSERAQAAYPVARQVFDAELSPTEGARLINSRCGMNVNSARDHIYVYKQLRLGQEFHRGLSASDMDFYLSQIKSDLGAPGVQIALHALWRHIRYYEGVSGVNLNKLRSVAVHHAELAPVPPTDEEKTLEFEDAVRNSSKGSPEERRRRLASAPKIPSRSPVVHLSFDRNPDVVAEVLFQATGICGRCRQPAPFLRRKDGSAYLEVHHKKQLSQGGEDTVENAIALCPNCHRDLHYGAGAA